MNIQLVKDGKVVREMNFDTEKIKKLVVSAGVYSFLSGEVSRIRPPKRNIGAIMNMITAAALTDAITKVVFTGRGKDEPEVVAEQAEEMKDVDEGDKS